MAASFRCNICLEGISVSPIASSNENSFGHPCPNPAAQRREPTRNAEIQLTKQQRRFSVVLRSFNEEQLIQVGSVHGRFRFKRRGFRGPKRTKTELLE